MTGGKKFRPPCPPPPLPTGILYSPQFHLHQGDQDGGPPNSMIDICDLKEKVGDCDLLVNCEPKNPALEMDSPVPLTHHDPKVLGLICLLKKRKIHFRILSDSRIHPWIFLKKRTLIFESDVKGEALHCKARFSGLFGLSADQFQNFQGHPTRI